MTAKPTNRVIYWVIARFSGSAQPVGDLLWQQRRKVGDQPERGMKVQTYAAEGPVLKLVIDYTVKGGYPADVKRMLAKAATGVGLRLVDLRQCEEKSRERVDL